MSVDTGNDAHGRIVELLTKSGFVVRSRTDPGPFGDLIVILSAGNVECRVVRDRGSILLDVRCRNMREWHDTSLLIERLSDHVNPGPEAEAIWLSQNQAQISELICDSANQETLNDWKERRRVEVERRLFG